jgi:hypothetical protein
MPIPSRSSSCTVLIPAPSLSPTSVPNIFQEYETLRPGKHIRRRLAESDQSFTVTFYDLYATVSFDIAQSAGGEKDTTPWVRIGFLESTEQPKLGSDGDNIISLEDISEGAEVAVTHGVGGPQTVLYVHWKQQAISIQCMSQLCESSCPPILL